MAAKKRVQYYKTFEDDFVESSDQDYTLPDDYIWVRDSKGGRLARAVLYAVGYLFALLYGKLRLHLKIARAVDLNDYRDTGAVIYGNHTQPIGDVFVPGLVCAPKRFYTICSPANLGIPVIGRLLPWMGALPIPESISKMGDFLCAVQQRLKEKTALSYIRKGTSGHTAHKSDHILQRLLIMP